MSKYKILTLSDHPLVSSGVGIQTRYIIEGLLATQRYSFLSLGGALKHADYRPQLVNPYGEDWKIFPIDGYGNENILRSILDNEKPDAIYFMTDPRFYMWLFNMSDEIRDRGIPMLYYTVWDNFPVPLYNKLLYHSCDYIGCISKLTYDVVCQLEKKEDADYIPHAVNADIFKPFEEGDILRHKTDALKTLENKFVVFYNSRNARRKSTSDIIRFFKLFLDKANAHDDAFMLMHTDPNDMEGANLHEVVKIMNLEPKQISFSSQRLPPEQIAILYNIADVTINISSNEGFGLSCLESLMCGTPVIVNKTGGLQDQPVDDKGNVFGVMINPAVKSLTGSQQIPYIFDDKCSEEDVVNALMKMYKMTWKERKEMGRQAHKWCSQTFSMKNLVEKWDKAFTKYIEKFKKHGYQDRIKISKI